MPYPTALPFAEIKRTAAYLKEGTVKENFKQFAADIYEIQGYVFGTFIGQPPALTFGSVGSETAGNMLSVNVTIADKQVLSELVCLEDVKYGVSAADPEANEVACFQSSDGNVGKLDIAKIMAIAIQIY